MGNKTLLFRIIIFIILFNFIIYSVVGSPNENKIKTNLDIIKSSENSPPGEIIGISFSNKYPTIGTPLDIIITINGNPLGKRFTETITIINEFEGLIFKSSIVEWKFGNLSLDSVEVNVGKLPIYRKKIEWYPVVAGNHTFIFKAGDYPEIKRNISVGFYGNNIIFPSIGCPSIINKNETNELTMLISEERLINEEYLEILSIKLKKIDESQIYILDDQIFEINKWINSGENKFEDELIVKYNINEIPSGFYNLTINTLKNEYIWPHAVKIIDNEPENFKFVQLSDTHIGKVYNLIDESEVLGEVFNFLNEEIQPDIVLITGDLIDWYNDRSIGNSFDRFKEVISKCNYPVYLTAGNHERYENRLLLLYNPFNDLSNYHLYLNPINDYSFEYGNINFIILDSGYDYSRWEIKPNFWKPSPEGSGLTNTQFYLLENELGNNRLNQNIFMHHPAVNYEDDNGLFYVFDDLPSGNNECIAFNRGNLIDYCLNNNVSLIFTGHTHNINALNYLGEDVLDPFDWPIFLQTDSTTLPNDNIGGRVIDVNNGEILNYEYVSLFY